MLLAVARKLQKTLNFADGITPVWSEPAPTEAEIQAAAAAVLSARVISRAEFMALFSPQEIHDIQRRAAQSAGTSATAPAVANVWAHFVAVSSIHSDSADLAQGLAVLLAAGLLTQARANQVAKFEPLTPTA